MHGVSRMCRQNLKMKCLRFSAVLFIGIVFGWSMCSFRARLQKEQYDLNVRSVLSTTESQLLSLLECADKATIQQYVRELGGAQQEALRSSNGKNRNLDFFIDWDEKIQDIHMQSTGKSIK